MSELLGVLVFAAVLCVLTGVRAIRQRDTAWRRAVTHKVPTPVTPDGAGTTQVRTAHVILGRLETEARKAGLRATGVQMAAVALLAAVLAAALAYSLVPSAAVAAGVSLLGLLAPRWWVGRARARRAEAFSASLDGALGILASTLRGGASLAQAVRRAATQGSGPAAEELDRAARIIALGGTVAEAFAAVSRRVDSRDWELVVVATHILTRTGGNLADIYDHIAGTIRARRMARRTILAQTTQMRITASLVAAIPVVVTIAVRLLNPGYFAPMLDNAAGMMVFAGAFGLIGLGWLWLRRMADVDAD